MVRKRVFAGQDLALGYRGIRGSNMVDAEISYVLGPTENICSMRFYAQDAFVVLGTNKICIFIC